MKNRYLCKQHAYRYCQNLEQAQRDWEHCMAMGLEAINRLEQKKAERCFGSAHEIANIIFDRQTGNNDDEIDMAANTLLSAQYLATSLVQQNQSCQAKQVLKQLYQKFSFACRNPRADRHLRETLANKLIPYVEKLYLLVPDATTSPVLERPEKNPKQADQNQLPDHHRINSRPNYGASFWHKGSTLYH